MASYGIDGSSPQCELVSRFLAATRSTIKVVLPMILEAHQAPSRAASCKSDGSLVTSTDHQVELAFISTLRAALPEAIIVAEESEAERMLGFSGDAEEFYAALSAGSPLVVVDPIDGTKNFVEGHREFCIAAALVSKVEGGVWPLAGVVAIPLEDRMLVSDGRSVSDGCISSGEHRPLIRDASAATQISVSSTDRRWLAEHSFELLYPWVSSGSSVYDMVGTITGRLKGSIIGKQRFWDLMAPLALASAAGLELRDLLSGERLSAIGMQDLSKEIKLHLWGLNRKVAIVPPVRQVSDLVKHRA